MKLYFLVCSAFLIPLILGTNDTTLNPEHKNGTEAVAEKVHKTTENATKTLITEGGAIIQNTHSLYDLNIVHKEVGNVSHSSIVARKGAGLNETDFPYQNATDYEIDKLKNKTHKKVSAIKQTTDFFKSKSDIKNSSVASPMPSVETKEPEKVKVPKKPLTLSYEALSNMDLKFESSADSLHKTMSLASIASVPITKVHPISQHPGMIMPIVIAILVVPMFAVLGYMALRRGQEAWKNRHYKRMDFLLDGMYNE